MLEANNLMVFYKNMQVLNNISITCDNNRIIGIFGANSAGKSILMYALSGIMLDIKKKELMAGSERISISWEVKYNGMDIIDLKPIPRAKAGIVLCPERRRIFNESTVLENLKIGDYLATKAQAKETLDYILDVYIALEGLKNRTGGFLSEGEQQMLAVDRALMAQPKILFLDEPLMGLSTLMQATLIRSTKKIQQEKNISVIISEQYARPVFPIVDYAYILGNGSAVVEGSREELIDNPDVKSAYFGI